MALRRVLAALGVGLAAVVVFQFTDYALNLYRARLVPKNFSVVKPGVLYRSGQMSPEHFEQVVRHHGIRTVVCLNHEESGDERDRAQRLGVRYVTFAMPGSGQGAPAYFHQILELMGDARQRPILVHCAAGAYRTGATVALYRMLYEGWMLEDAVEEMRYSGFAGQQDLIDHIRATFDTIPSRLRERLEPPASSAARRAGQAPVVR